MSKEDETLKDSAKREIKKNPANQKSGDKPGAPKSTKEKKEEVKPKK